MTWLIPILLLLPGCGGGTGAEVRPLSPDTLAAWVDAGIPMVLLDTRSRSAYDARHVPAAISAEKRTVTQLREVLPANPAMPLVIYDGGGEEVRGARLALEAAGVFGFPLVYLLEGGMAAYATGGRQLEGNALMTPEPEED